ncbi:MAG: asparagine synthase (glutamine-hydrolyzing) [Desulfarculaceae bacterium]|nr:asparagine synthase (glutamine-hydrolyzing) [Desulfarculaceae bacterium]MCF8073349.1 asparagine synthase (glutamine-hydrolyzing) [Desulfarculaceae bacterium]MCF8103215.1 asparagine synthase (glutamine-hydrolyzing) [Desulfarculaceae bacterium]MCF8116599.1 asparagine synthase (glutamine-hydrolyzing) [Desulfarculaceae bacterium]
MCGINGFSWEDTDLIRAMGDRLEHRGPDDRHEITAFGASLGQTRLSIIDLSPLGRQPMVNESGDIHLVVNGEIYNHLDLRQELVDAGHEFYSNSDSEVVLHGYEQWGPGVIERLQGMFCFAVLDGRNRRIMLGRDRLGIKPLYYHHAGNKLIFSNEIKALLAWPGLERRVDPQALFQYLGYEYVPAPRTLFAGVNKLRQGHYAIFDLSSGDFQEKQYWDLKFSPRFSQPEEAVEELRSLLRLSVKRRLMSDVPLGVFLSGGLDSTTVVALMRELGVEHLRTYSIAYPDPSFSELEYANDMAEHYGTDQTVLMIEGLSLDDLEAAVYHLDEPMTDLSAIPLMLICREAKKTATVVLSGEGGDEIFAGYDRFRASKAAGYLSRLPGCAPTLNRLASLLPDQPQKKGAVNVAKRFLEGCVLPREGEHLRWQYFLPPDLAGQLFQPEVAAEVGIDDPFAPVRRVLASCNSSDRLDREVYLDLKLAMADSVLMKVDKMSMSTSLEVRVPFLDHEVVEFTASLPSWFKLKGFTTKYILRQAIRGLVPDRVAFRGKQGYSLPVKNLLRGQLQPLMQELLTSSPLVSQFLNRTTVDRLMTQHLAGTHNHNHVLWAMMNAALWHRRFFEN